MTIRPITRPEELDLFFRFPYVLNPEVADELTAGRRRPEWLWVALREFRTFADTEEVIALTTEALAGTLDAHPRPQ